MSTLAVEARAPEVQAPAPGPWGARLPQGWTPRRIALLLFALWALSGVYLVAPDQQAVETRFGKVVAPRVTPGIHYALPWPIDRVAKLKVRQQQRLVIGGDLQDGILGRTQPLLSQFITGDQNIINIRVVVQYSVGVPADYLFQTLDVGKAVAGAVEAELARRIAQRNVDAVLTTEKVAIQEQVRAAAQQRMNQYRTGVLLSSINIESVAPPTEAADAFRDVASARADAVRIVNEAQGYANDVIPKARGEARQLIESAKGFKQSKIDQALGDASRFTQLAAEYSKAAQVTGDRLYMETMELILPRIRKMIVDSGGNLDLTIIRKGDTPAAPPRK